MVTIDVTKSRWDNHPKSAVGEPVPVKGRKSTKIIYIDERYSSTHLAAGCWAKETLGGLMGGGESENQQVRARLSLGNADILRNRRNQWFGKASYQ